jgi:hypothetical protein
MRLKKADVVNPMRLIRKVQECAAYVRGGLERMPDIGG